MVNICHKMLKMFYQVSLSIQFQFYSLSARAISFSFVDVTATPLYQYTNLATMHTAVHKFVLSTSKINISSTPVVVILSSYLT